MESSAIDTLKKDGPEEELFEMFMTGGPPWGFTISGGSEFGTDLFVKRVAEDGIARKVGGLKEGDQLVFLNNVKCTSRAHAIDTVKMGKNELKIQLKRIQSMDLASNAGQKGSAPKRSNSFYGTVVEQMLENVSSDISSTHYAQRRNSIRTDKGSPRKIEVRTEKFNLNRSMDEDKMKNDRIEDSPKSSNNESSLSPSDESNKFRSSQSRNFQRVKVKSVKVTSMVPGMKNDISEQLKVKMETSPESKKDEVTMARRDRLMKDTNLSRQTKSMDDTRPQLQESSLQLKAKALPTAIANRSFTPVESISDTTPINMAKARTMFEKMSKSQESLDMAETKSHPKRSSPAFETKGVDDVKNKQPSDQTAIRQNDFPFEEPVLQPLHSHTQSLPSENSITPKRDLRRPGVVPHRHSNRRIRPKSAHFPSEEDSSETQNLPLGYGPVPSNNRIAYGRKSIASSTPSADNGRNFCKKESAFRHSSEDVRATECKEFAARPERKSSTLPASQMREAAKRFHQELMRKDPKFRYSIGQIDPATRTSLLGSSTGDSSSSSLSSSQDQLNSADSSRRLSNGPSYSSRACSTSSLDSSPGPQEILTSQGDDDNTILSRLLREQRVNNNGNLVRIEEEVRSPRARNVVANEASETAEEDSSKGRRTISIQTEFFPEDSKKVEINKRSSSDQNLSPLVSQNHMAIETCIDDVDPPLIEKTAEEPEFKTTQSEQSTHTKEPSSDSIAELDEINKNMKHAVEGENEDDFPITDIDALPPPPEELLVASPPEKEKPQRVINRKKRDQNSGYATSRNSSCVSTDSNISTSTMDSGIGVRAYSPRNSPTRVTSEYDDDYNQGYDEGFKGSREELLNDDCQTYSPSPNDELEQKEYKDDERTGESPENIGTPSSGSRPNSASTSPRIEELDQEKASLIESMRKKIEELKLQEQEIAEEITSNEDLGKRVRRLIEMKATQTEFSKYELFIGELNKIVALLLSLTQRLHRYEQMLQDFDMSEDEDKQKRETLISKIEKLRSQHEEACHLREVNDKRGENVANFLDKYFNEDEFADFQYYVDMKSQLALMQSEIKEKVKLGEERYRALDSTGKF